MPTRGLKYRYRHRAWKGVNMYVKTFPNTKFNMVICELSNTVLDKKDLQNVQLVKMLREYDKPLMEWLSNLGVRFVHCANSAWIETTDHTKIELYHIKGTLEKQFIDVLDWVTNPKTRIPSQAERDKQYEAFSKRIENMIERMFEIVDGE